MGGQSSMAMLVVAVAGALAAGAAHTPCETAEGYDECLARASSAIPRAAQPTITGSHAAKTASATACNDVVVLVV